ncbi:DUF6208 family protein [Pleurocapsa sp. PCC 7327]|uniref:DUF6208 family protein n=1 Tax=Pleurocapsa sp. PCC 7327 TaxID=118163 RepID=UPI0020C772C0|nr:DUF6208 family protein [Pleurocapsa sp. PCC 7327]
MITIKVLLRSREENFFLNNRFYCYTQLKLILGEREEERNLKLAQRINMKSDRKIITNNRFSLIGEIPLAILSLFFYKAMKFIVGNLYTFYLTVDKKKTFQWRVLSAENLKSSLSLPVLMTKGPRWNTHAIIGTLGPFSVKESIALDTESAKNSAGSWIAVIYSFPSYQTITSLESDRLNSQDKWETLKLKPGKYSIGLRYYQWRDRVNLPAVTIDGVEFVSSCPVPSDTNNFYYDLIKHKNWFYLALHYYIFTILRLRKYLPESFVRNEYLPVGAPDTQFVYGYLMRGQSLQIESNSSLVKNYNIYLTLYDRSSLPLFWSKIESEKFLTQPIENHGFYLIRLRSKPNLEGNSAIKLPIESQLKDEDSLVQRLQIFLPY